MKDFGFRIFNLFWILMLGFWIVIGCGSEKDLPQGISFSETAGDVGYIHLSLSNSESPSLLELGTISKYRLKIEGEGFETLEQTFSKEAGGVVIQGIPVGPNRRIQVLALNSRDQVLREGVAENITIERGKQSQLEIILYSVPVILNLKQDDYLSNQRLYFHILTDPHHRLAVEGESPLRDIISGLETLESNQAGLSKFYPGVFPAGDATFTVFDLDSEKSSKVLVHLWDGSAIKGASLFASSQSQKRLGQVFANQTELGAFGGELLPNIVEALWKTR